MLDALGKREVLRWKAETLPEDLKRLDRKALVGPSELGEDVLALGCAKGSEDDGLLTALTGDGRRGHLSVRGSCARFGIEISVMYVTAAGVW